MITAQLTALNSFGRYRIEAMGFSIDTPYPENRIAHALNACGYKGQFRTVMNGKVRMICDIAAMSRKRLAETDRDGFCFRPWDGTEETLRKMAMLDNRASQLRAERRAKSIHTPAT